jgi:hypothetical protein
VVFAILAADGRAGALMFVCRRAASNPRLDDGCCAGDGRPRVGGAGCADRRRAQLTVYAYGRLPVSSELKVLKLNVSRVRKPCTWVPAGSLGVMSTVM